MEAAFEGREKGDRGLQLLFNFRNCTYLNPMSQSRKPGIALLRASCTRTPRRAVLRLRSAFPCSSVLRGSKPVEKKELLRVAEGHN